MERFFPYLLVAAAFGQALVPNTDIHYKLASDALVMEGVPVGEIRGPFTLPSEAYPGTQHTYWVYVPAQYDAAVATSLMIYQDGQAFSGLLVFPQLRQGADVVRAFENGGTRFTYVGTLDVRLQKGFTLGRSTVDLILDGYNLSHLQNEVEEYPVINTRFREVTAIQPPLAFHLGARFSF